MELIKLLNRIKENYKEVEELKIYNPTGTPGGDYSTPKIGCDLTLRDENDKLISYEEMEVRLHFKSEKVVELGDHQGFNDNDEPIVIEYVLKPLVVIANELVAKIEALIGKKAEIKSLKESVRELKETEKLIKKQVSEDAEVRLKTLGEDEQLMPELKLIESGEED